MLIEIKLIGSLGQRFGRLYRLDIETPAEAIRGLAAQLDGFLDYLYEAAAAGVGWQIIDDRPMGMLVDDLGLRIKTNRLILAPRVNVAGGNVFNIIAGAALIGFAWLVPGGFLLSAASFSTLGVGLLIGGLTGLLSPPPVGNTDSETLGRAAQQGYQGLAVPILYGTCYVNDLIPISGTVYSQDIPLGVDGQGSINWSGGLTPEVDPYPTLTKILLHLDRSMSDSKSNTSPVGISENFSSDNKAFGSHSYVLSGVSGGSYISIPSVPAIDIGTSNATLEAQYLIQAPDSSNTANQSTLISRFNSTTGLGYYWLYDHALSKFIFASDSFTASWNYTLSTVTPVFQHLALSIDTDNHTVNCFVQGISLGAIAFPGTLGNPTLPLLIGANQGSAGIDRRLKGYVDEFRLSIGVARYSATFTPPTASYANS